MGLHERLTQRIDELEALANETTDCYMNGVPGLLDWGSLAPPLRIYISAWVPAIVLRGLAEDRDILARHPMMVCGMAGCWGFCVQCGSGDECPGPCAELCSLARRHGVNPEEA